MAHIALLRPVRSVVTVVGALCVAGSLAACDSTTSTNPPQNSYAAINIRAVNAPNGQGSAKATGVIFDAYNVSIPVSVQQRTDQCLYAGVDTSTALPTGAYKAGSAITLSYGTTTVSMPYDSVNFRYASPAASPFRYAAGDVVQATIPGVAGGFPAATISLRLAEPLIPGAIKLPTGTEPMTFTWNAASDSLSAIIVSLRYANPITSSYANEQIYCALNDDGLYQLSGAALTAFFASPADKRSLVMTRWRTNQLATSATSLLHISSSVDTTIRFTP